MFIFLLLNTTILLPGNVHQELLVDFFEIFLEIALETLDKLLQGSPTAGLNLRGHLYVPQRYTHVFERHTFNIATQFKRTEMPCNWIARQVV